MPKQVFIIGIGGTGMRCIESFVHLCAMGMFDDTNVHMLALDTDRENGNFTRLKDLKEAYLKTKGVNKIHSALKNTFFSANLTYYQYSPDYSKKSNFDAIFDYDSIKIRNSDEKAIADLLLTESAKTFDLKHGYRAQTHLGSMLMYHSIIDDVKTNTKGDLRRFIQELITASTAGRPRIFILGSVFGGTGASSIPIIPRAMKKAAAYISSATDIEKNAFFGSILLTSYFAFNIPNEDERTRQKLIATHDKFSLNSQAAMMFYEADDTVKQTYQKFYMMGTENLDWKPSKFKDKTVTGGEDQENDSHYIELLAAFAAYDFFNLPELELKQLKDDKELVYQYRTFDNGGKIEFTDFIDSEKKEELAKKFGMFTAMSYLVLLDKYDLFGKAQNGDLKKVNIEGYEDIDLEEVKNLKTYMGLYHFRIQNSVIKDGWLRQLHHSAGSEDKFLFNSGLFSAKNIQQLEKFAFNNSIYQKNSDFESKKFRSGVLGLSSIWNDFFAEFIKIPEPDVTNNCEKLIKRTYDTLCKIYKF